MNEKGLNNLINQNDRIPDEDLRKIMHESWNLIFQFMGKQNFIRWINQKELSDRIRVEDIEEFTEDEKNKHPTWNGFYTDGTNRIKLRQKDNLSTNIHETYHFITDSLGKSGFK